MTTFQPKPHSVLDEVDAYMGNLTERPYDHVEGMVWDLAAELRSLLEQVQSAEQRAAAREVLAMKGNEWRLEAESLKEQVQALELACDHHKMFWQKAEERERGLKEQFDALIEAARMVCQCEEYESAGRPPCSSCLMRLREAIAGRRPTDLDDISPSDLGDGMEATVEPGAAMTEAELDAFYPAKRQEDG